MPIRRPLASTPLAQTSYAPTRRSVLRGAALAGAALGLGGPLAACSSGGSSGSSGPVTFGSNFSDAVPKKGMQQVFDAFPKNGGSKVTVHTTEHNAFQEQINSYLQGTPDDVFSWFAGFRMQFFAQKGLSTPIDDVWAKVGANYSDPLSKASTGLDGKKYFVPFYNYPWAVFYRKSVFAEKGYQIPKTFDEFKTLAAKMKTDGLVPLAMGNDGGWPAMGTFDYLNMRLNGYDFHISLMHGKESWTDKKVKDVFDLWKGLLPYTQPGALGRKWEEAATTLLQKKAGMFVLGMFVGQQFTDPADQKDLDFFAFPEIAPENAQDAVEAPIDGFMLSKKPKNMAQAKKLLEFFASGKAQDIYLAADPNNIATAKDADTSKYNDLQKKAVEIVSSAKQISQFMDRDTNPTFASTVMIPALAKFIGNPGDVDSIVKSIDAQAKTIFTS
jgi:multiple sugar transport system substrate-binding protein